MRNYSQFQEHEAITSDGGATPGRRFPASSFQERIWLAEKLANQRALYNVPMAWRVSGSIEADILQSALALLVEQHEIFRTRFLEENGRLMQEIMAPWVPELRCEDLTGLPASERGAEIARLLRQTANRSFDPSSGKLISVTLLQAAPEEQVLCICMHHLVWDEASTPIFLRDLQHYYKAAERNSAGTEREGGEREDAKELDNRRPPLTPTARVLGAIWSYLLQIPAPAADDSFFEVGGHSLATVQLMSRVADRFKIQLPLRRLFDNPKLQDFADLIDRERAQQEPSSLDQNGPADPYRIPASSFQSRIWLAERLEPTLAVYNMPLAWYIQGRPRLDDLQAMLNQVIREHEILRTRFVEQGGRLYQTVADPFELEIETQDLTGFSSRQQKEALEARFAWEMKHKFDPATGRLMRAALLDLGTEQVLFLCFHHLIMDAASIGIFLHELDRAYRIQHGERTASVRRPQYRDFVLGQLEENAGPAFQAHLDYWVQNLEGAPHFLPFALPSQPEANGTVPIPLAAGCLQQMQALQKKQGVSWFMVIAAALAALLHRWTGQDDITFGCPIINREDAALEDVIGPCMNMVILRSRRDAETTMADLLHTMREAILGAFEHKNIPFEMVVNRLNPARRAGRAPYIDIALNLNVISGKQISIAGLEFRPAVFATPWQAETESGLIAHLQEERGKLTGFFSYRGNRFKRSDVEKMAYWFGELLSSYSDNLERRLADIFQHNHKERGVRRVQYRDFVLAQMAESKTGKLATGLEFWAQNLDGAPCFLPLSTPAHPEANDTVPIPLRDTFLETVRAKHGKEGTSWFMVVAAALAALLHRWTGKDDITFGCPIINREDPALEDVIGPCMNMVVLRSRCDANTTVAQLLRTMRDTVLGAFENRNVFFEMVMDRMNPPRRPGWTPYIDVTLAADATSPSQISLGGFELAPWAMDHHGADYVAKFALTVGFVETAGRLRGFIGYDGRRFTALQVKQIATLFGIILQAFIDRLDQPVQTLNLVNEEERSRLLQFERGAPAAPLTNVPEMLWLQCRLRPDSPAIVSSRGVQTYQGLEKRSNVLAAKLRSVVQQGDVVAVVLPRSEDLIVAMLAAWKAGCCFSPMDTTYPQARIDALLDDLQASVILTDNGPLRKRLGNRNIPVLTVADISGDEKVDLAAETFPDPNSIAYVLYTSGSTGEPKGVPIRHSSLAQFARWYIDDFQVQPSDRASALCSVGFDGFMWEIWPTLCAGACVVPYEPALVVATELASWLDEQNITLCFAPTVLAETLWSIPAPLPRLRWMLFAGSALTRRPPQELKHLVCNTYGPTETTIIVSALRMNGDGVPLNCIGKPIAGACLYVLDEAGHRCPVGVPGEIYIGGAGVAPGYWRRPELTRQRFFSGVPDESAGLVYKTGDQGRWLDDGNLEFLGRLDRQIKIQGYRVEPQEIEIALRGDPLVDYAVVQYHPGNAARLVAYLVAKKGVTGDTQAVIERLSARLPAFMVPNAVVWLEELPISAQGKLDTRKLLPPTRDNVTVRTRAVAPVNDLERRIAGIWSEVLGVGAGVHDNFFDLGGNSLRLATLHTRLQAELKVSLPIQMLFEYPTVYTLACALNNSNVASASNRNTQDDTLRQRAERSPWARRAATLEEVR